MVINQLKAGAFLSYLSIGLNNLIGLFYIPFMLRMMGQNEYGLFSLVTSVIAYLTVLDFGFGNAIVRYTAKYRAEGKQAEQYDMFGIFLFLYSVIGLVAFLIGLGFYFNVEVLFNRSMTGEDLEKIRIMMLLMMVNLAFTFPMSLFGSIITAYEDFVFQKLINIGRIILNPLVMIVILMMGYRAIGMVVVTTLFNVATLLIHCWYCFYKIRIKIHFSHFKWGFLKEISIYSFWIFLNAIMDRIYWSTGQFVLGALTGAASVAVFAVSIQMVTMYMSFSTAISGVFLPRVTAMVVQEKSCAEISDLFIRTGRIQYIVLTFILSGFILFGSPFILLWAGEGYGEVYRIALLFFVALTIPLSQNIGTIVLQARNQMKFRSLLYIAISTGSLLLQIVGAKLYGGMGCAIAIAGALILGHGLVMNWYYWRVLNIDIFAFWKEIGKTSVIPAAFVGAGWYVVQWCELENIRNLTGAILLYTVVYMSLFWRWGLNDKERGVVKVATRRLLNRQPA